jgi:hypothetical protein
MFGSTARDEAREDSDVDLFFDHPEGSLGLFALMDVKEAAARILGRKADVMTRRSQHRVLRPAIELRRRGCFDGGRAGLLCWRVSGAFGERTRRGPSATLWHERVAPAAVVQASG